MKKLSPHIIAWFPVLLWMLLIFFLSAQSATESDGLSKGLTKIILAFFDRLVPAFGSGTAIDYLLYLDHFVRKLTHFLLYLVLGALAARALRKNAIIGWKPLVLAVLICALYAMTDEIHQIFVPGRSGQVGDVIIDSMGGLVGVALQQLGSRNRCTIG
jgi:VanZ family protein